MEPSAIKRLDAAQALPRLRHYCAYSERCHTDVVKKLYDLGVWQKDQDAIIATLIEEGFLNEERFAKVFAGGHFRQKQWGRHKIKQYLKRKDISNYCINKAMLEIDEEAYEKTAQQLFQKKWKELTGEKNRFAKMRKVSDFLIQKGFETDIVHKIIQINIK